MKSSVLKIATRKFKQLQGRYSGFINVVVDDWRGWRFVYDTKDVRQCRNNCPACPLYQLLKKEKSGLFSAGLRRASAADKKLFGPQNFLNCKTLVQYRACYVNWLLTKASSRREINQELVLVNSLRVIFSRSRNALAVEKDFKRSIVERTCKLAKGYKKKILKESV